MERTGGQRGSRQEGEEGTHRQHKREGTEVVDALDHLELAPSLTGDAVAEVAENEDEGEKENRNLDYEHGRVSSAGGA